MAGSTNPGNLSTFEKKAQATIEKLKTEFKTITSASDMDKAMSILTEAQIKNRSVSLSFADKDEIRFEQHDGEKIESEAAFFNNINGISDDDRKKLKAALQQSLTMKHEILRIDFNVKAVPSAKSKKGLFFNDNNKKTKIDEGTKRLLQWYLDAFPTIHRKIREGKELSKNLKKELKQELQIKAELSGEAWASVVLAKATVDDLISLWKPENSGIFNVLFIDDSDEDKRGRLSVHYLAGFLHTLGDTASETKYLRPVFTALLAKSMGVNVSMPDNEPAFSELLTKVEQAIKDKGSDLNFSLVDSKQFEAFVQALPQQATATSDAVVVKPAPSSVSAPDKPSTSETEPDKSKRSMDAVDLSKQPIPEQVKQELTKRGLSLNEGFLYQLSDSDKFLLSHDAIEITKIERAEKDKGNVGQFSIVMVKGVPFALLNEIGRGGTARAKYAQNLSTGEWVAAKISLWGDKAPKASGKREEPQLKGLSDADMARRVDQETKMAELYYQGTASSVYAQTRTVKQEKGNTYYKSYLFLPLGETSLRDKLNKSIDAEETQKIAKALLADLVLLTHKGMVHNDIKPDNVVFDETGKACLIDFGEAHEVGKADEGRVIGFTRSYAPPERLHPMEGADVNSILTHQSDMFSMGKVLAQLYGVDVRYRFTDETLMPEISTTAVQKNHPVFSTPTVMGSATPPLQKAESMRPLIEWMTEEKPENRPTATQAQLAFNDISSGKNNTALQNHMAEKKRDAALKEKILELIKLNQYKVPPSLEASDLYFKKSESDPTEFKSVVMTGEDVEIDIFVSINGKAIVHPTQPDQSLVVSDAVSINEILPAVYIDVYPDTQDKLKWHIKLIDSESERKDRHVVVTFNKEGEITSSVEPVPLENKENIVPRDPLLDAPPNVLFDSNPKSSQPSQPSIVPGFVSRLKNVFSSPSRWPLTNPFSSQSPESRSSSAMVTASMVLSTPPTTPSVTIVSQADVNGGPLSSKAAVTASSLASISQPFLETPVAVPSPEPTLVPHTTSSVTADDEVRADKGEPTLLKKPFVLPLLAPTKINLKTIASDLNETLNDGNNAWTMGMHTDEGREVAILNHMKGWLEVEIKAETIDFEVNVATQNIHQPWGVEEQASILAKAFYVAWDQAGDAPFSLEKISNDEMLKQILRAMARESSLKGGDDRMEEFCNAIQTVQLGDRFLNKKQLDLYKQTYFNLPSVRLGSPT